MKHIVIIGNGISGITAARHIRKRSKDALTVVSAESDYFFSRTALMYIFMGHMKYEHTKPYEDDFWVKNDINLVRDFVQEVDIYHKHLSLASGNRLSYDILILACGSKPNRLGWPGETAKGVQGLVSLQDLESLEANTKDIESAVIVGGGLIGVEMAEMLLSRKIQVTMLIREPEFWSNVLPIEEAAMVSKHLLEHEVQLRKTTQLKRIITDDHDAVIAVETDKGEQINCQFVGLTTGVSPSIDFLKTSDIETDKGVLVNEFFETNITDVYAIGDCAQFRQAPKGRKAIEQNWYTGRMHGETLAHTIGGNKTAYIPGVWFNSAKFFDIEYQVYGEICSELPPSANQLLWQHQDGKKAIRIVYDRVHQHVLGFNLLGIRFRHEVCDYWIKHRVSITEVMKTLKKANFDPEFFDRHEEDVIATYNRQNPGNQIVLKKAKKRLGVINSN